MKFSFIFSGTGINYPVIDEEPSFVHLLATTVLLIPLSINRDDAFAATLSACGSRFHTIRLWKLDRLSPSSINTQMKNFATLDQTKTLLAVGLSLPSHT